MKSQDLDSILLVGGEGFFGPFIVSALRQQFPSSRISVAGLKPTNNSSEASYYRLDITNEQSVRILFEKTRPRLVFHLASPLPGAPTKSFYECNVTGTGILLRCAKKSQHVEALILTSSEQAIANTDFTSPLTEETAELWDSPTHRTRETDPYSRTKALSETLVRAANCSDLRTMVLRFPNVYGGTDAYMGIIMADFFDGRTNIRLGNSKARWEFVSVQSAAHAHVLAAQAILSPSPFQVAQVAAQVFHISDDHPETWYNFAEKAWKYAGDSTRPEQIWTVPLWIILVAAWLWEWMLLVFTLGYVEPGRFYVGNVKKFETGMHRLDISKARAVLGFKPLLGREEREEALKNAVRRAIEHREKIAGESKKKAWKEV